MTKDLYTAYIKNSYNPNKTRNPMQKKNGGQKTDFSSS